jgi:peroxiredoxin
LAERFGLAYTVPDYLRDYYLSVFVNLPFINGDENWRLPIPATYVISPAGLILYAQAHADFRLRPEPVEALTTALAAIER